ncbi:MAG: TlpA disulfide reductase family protein [Acidobacteria bacterium]|nr:TlpA disulfide reductase family protein [Acidobacteriota bacterium]MDA1233642.1 TlpA disulfide reductase family protein [Acidobacteriota bacterium]
MKFLTTALIAGLLTFASMAAAADTPRAGGKLEITTLEGKQLDIKDLAGKPVLVFYFSTDCSHCQATARILAPIYEEYHVKGLEIVGVTLNPTAKDNLGGFVKQFGVEFPVGLGDRAHFVEFSGVAGRFYYPYLLFVDQAGQIREEHEGADRAYFADLNASLRKSLDQLLTY